MRTTTLKSLSILLALSLSLSSIGCGSKKDAPNSAANAPTTAAPNSAANTSATPASNTAAPVSAAAANFSDRELDELFAPIALYPDPLLAQIIPASTFGDDITQASKALNGKVDDNLIDRENWDVSVKAVAHYPKVLTMMADKPDWTAAIGQAYVNQSTDVMKSIQRLRSTAKNNGALTSTPQQTVEQEGEAIKIEPAEPQVIYVPEYKTEVVYAEAPPAPPTEQGHSTGTVVAASALAFGAGLAIGSWLNRDYNWYGGSGGGIYYHGWSGGSAWVGANRGYVNVNNNVYVNNSYRNVNVNQNVVNRNINSYRSDVNTRVASNRGVNVNRTAGNYNPANRPANMTTRPIGNPARIDANRDVAGRNGVNNRDVNGARNGANNRDVNGARNGANNRDVNGARNGANNRDGASARNGTNHHDTSGRNNANRPANTANAGNHAKAGQSGHNRTAQTSQAKTHQSGGHNKGGQKPQSNAKAGGRPPKR